MSNPGTTTATARPLAKLWQSGIILSAAGLLTGLGNFAFTGIIGRALKGAEGAGGAEFGYVINSMGFITLLGLPVAIASTSLTHYIAHYNSSGDDARLKALLAGCHRFLLKLTIAGSVLAAVLAKPLSDFFHFPRLSLLLVSLVCLLMSLWGGFAAALCQGMSWYKRLAFIGLFGVVLKLTYSWLVIRHFPVAEAGVAATGIALLGNLVLLYWHKELSWHGAGISPWNVELGRYFVVAAAAVGGGYCFTTGDVLVAQRSFSDAQLSSYAAAGQLGRALPMLVGPLLTVLFTSRSGRRSGDIAREQLQLLGLYALGLAAGALGLVLLRNLWVSLIFGKASPEAAGMIARFAVSMAFIGLIQALGMWALASRWFKVVFLYGALGLAYWITLLFAGTSPEAVLTVMPIGAAASFAVVFVAWLMTQRRPH